MPLPEELNEPGRPDHQLPNIISCLFFFGTKNESKFSWIKTVSVNGNRSDDVSMTIS
jgi:hypothetical protein